MHLLILFFVILIAFIGYLSNLNPTELTIHFSKTQTINLSVISLILLSMACGGIIVILFGYIRDVKNLFINWRVSRNKKKEARIQELYTKGLNLFLARRYDDAMSSLQKVITINPDHINTLLRLGNIYRLQGNFNEAIRLHKKARMFDEENMEVALSLAKDMDESGRFEESVQVLKEILKRDELNLTVLLKLRRIYIKTNKWRDADNIQSKIMKISLSEDEHKKELSIFLGIKYELGRELLEKGSIEKARKYFKESLKSDENFIPAYIGLGELLIKEDKIAAASTLWKRGHEITSNIILLHKLEELYIYNEEPDKIIEVYHEAIKRDPDNQALRFYLGKIYYRLEMIDDAFDVLMGIDLTNENFPDIYKVIGNLYIRKGDIKAAVEEFKKALNIKKSIIIPYYCSVCNYHTRQWSGRCIRCGNWNTYLALPIISEKTARKELVNIPSKSGLFFIPHSN